MLTTLLALTLVQDVRVLSPDGTLVVDIHPGSLAYEVLVDGQQTLSRSQLGLVFADGTLIGDHSEITKVSTKKHRGSWTDHFGKRLVVSDRWNETTLDLKDTTCSYRLVMRAYDDGVAFRYEFPSGQTHIKQDRSEFQFSADYRVLGGEFNGATEVNYPETHLSKLPAHPASLPIVVQTSNAYVAISEADVLNWAGMFLAKSNGFGVRASLASDVNAVVPCTSPWRVLMIGRKAGDLVESNLIKNLATPSKLRDTSWVKPGAMAWDAWWTGENPYLPQHKGLDARGDTRSDKEYIDLASKMGWPYQLVDWFWYDMGSQDADTAMKPVPTIDIAELVSYAKEKHVKLFLWNHSKDVRRADVDRLFATYEMWGIAGVKIDFIEDESQKTMQWYEDTLVAAARHKLMVIFHGCAKPSGLARTYPNYITQEGVLGNEYNKLPGERFNPKHMITLPFTRGLLGPADVTPAGFVNRSKQDFHTNSIPTQTIGTRTRQLALTILIDSPVMCMCDSPKNYEGQPGLEFLRGLPTVWDETRVLQADLAESIVLARRKGNDWWLAAMNGEPSLNLSIPLSFLGKGRFRMESFADGLTPTDVSSRTETVSASGTLAIKMNEAGGFVARLQRLP